MTVRPRAALLSGATTHRINDSFIQAEVDKPHAHVWRASTHIIPMKAQIIDADWLIVGGVLSPAVCSAEDFAGLTEHQRCT